MDLIEKMTSSELIFDGKVVHLYRDTVELPDGASAIREIVKHIGAVCVVPLTDDGDVILERQYRYAVGQILTEIPAGKLDYPGEDWTEAALRPARSRGTCTISGTSTDPRPSWGSGSACSSPGG